MSQRNDIGRDDAFAARTRRLFDDSVSHLSAHTRSRLRQARHAAVAELEATNHRRIRSFWVPLVGVTAALLLAISIVAPRLLSTRSNADVAFADADDVSLLMESDNVEMLEDMAFYAWLDDDAFGDAIDSDSIETAPAAIIEAVRS